MHTSSFIQDILSPVIYKSRIKLINKIISSVIKTKELNLTKLGRDMSSNIQERSGIRKMDRFLANSYFQKNSSDIYGCIINSAIGNKQRPWIIIDWTKLPNCNYYAIRASLAADGRAITLYEESHPKKLENHPDVNSSFLNKLKELLPVNCKPIIVTDAGFKNPWFKKVLNIGWDYVGRVRGVHKYTYSEDNGQTFQNMGEMITKGNTLPKYYGEIILTKTRPLKTNLYIVKKNLKGRKKLTKSKKIDNHKDSLNYSSSYRESWLIVSSIKSMSSAKKIINIYEKRMTIEEGIRDVKSSQYGLSMVDNITIKPERLIVWLMLAALVCYFSWVVGYFAEKRKLHYQFQANTIRKRRVLSFFYLGCQVLRKKIEIEICLSDIKYIESEESI